MYGTLLLIGTDDQAFSQFLKYFESTLRFEIRFLPMAPDLSSEIRFFAPDIIIIDTGDTETPDAYQFIFRNSNVPVILLTSCFDLDARIAALESGADDVLIKPYEARELAARIQAALRRTKHRSDNARPTAIRFENLEINETKRELKLCGQPVKIPPKEFRLLCLLTSKPNVALSRNELIQKVWNYDYLGDSRTVDVHIKRLRKRLQGVSERWAIVSVWGFGYKFEVKE